MSEEMARYEAQGMELARRPVEVLEQAREAAKALQSVITTKPKKVMIRGEQYLEFEDWQTVGRFYGVTAKTVSTAFIDIMGVQGFEARAVAVRNTDGMELSGADAMCLNDEDNWRSRPLFMLRSMAQTRACAKALRNVLAWVVVLAGYRPTPAEEMDGIRNEPEKAPPPPVQETKKAGDFLTAMSRERERLGDETFAKLLGNNGFEQPEDITERKAQVHIYKVMSGYPAPQKTKGEASV